ncbi:hypothetical protein BD779DRAFT_1441513 [Infundibulicybe gibba]|nr:hypothetical protein BD779DRAFT_1441513 [Infundibulicybe gibba]
MGIIISPEYRGKGYGQEAANIVLEHAFEALQCHRVQVTLVHHPEKFQAQALFTRMNFVHEGTRRRSFMSPFDLEWKDVTHLAMLETDWFMRSYARKAPHSLWDELFARHHREREELLLWEEERRMRMSGPSDKTLTNLKAMHASGEESSSSLDDSPSISGEDSEYDRCSISTFAGDDVNKFTDDDMKEFDDSFSPPDLADSEYASTSTEDRKKGIMDAFLCR